MPTFKIFPAGALIPADQLDSYRRGSTIPARDMEMLTADQRKRLRAMQKTHAALALGKREKDGAILISGIARQEQARMEPGPDGTRRLIAGRRRKATWRLHKDGTLCGPDIGKPDCGCGAIAAFGPDYFGARSFTIPHRTAADPHAALTERRKTKTKTKTKAPARKATAARKPRKATAPAAA